MIMTVIQPDLWNQLPERYSVNYLSGGRLIAYATPDAQEEIRDFLADLRKLQAMAVMVEARMITVSSGFLDKFSVNYPLIDLMPDGDGGAWTIASGALLPGSMIGEGFGTGISAGTDEGISFTVNYYDGIEVTALIEAVQKSEDHQTLNRPTIMLANGQMGYIDVSTETDYISELEPTVAESAVAITPSTDSITTGTTLTVRPTISYDGRYVQLALEPEISQLISISPYTYFTVEEGILLENTLQLLTTSEISLRSTVSVPDGGTAMLGGLTLAGESQVESGVPVLSNLPIIGRLFKKTGIIRDKQVIVFLVTPHVVIRDEYEAGL
ncbi:MAG: type II and III secretion system protein, partial [Planctomycetes bacterium]|nr:type II and III secretion system protein [Planctomycetota bacterium]